MAYPPQLVMIVFWALYSVDIFLVSLRVWVRKSVLKQKFLASDYLILMALGLALAGGSVCTWLMSMKLKGRANGTSEFAVVITLGLKRAETYLKMAWAATYIYYCAIYASKAAFLSFYYTLLPRFSKKMAIILHCITAFTVCTFLVNILINTFWCHPFSRNWSLDLKTQCSATITLPGFATATVTNVVTDILLMVIPLTLLRSLMLVRRELIAMVFVVTIGSVSIVSALIRFTLLYAISNSLDITKISIDAFIMWTNIDVAAALAAVCLPAFRVLLRGRKKSQASGSSGSYSFRKRRMLGDTGRGVEDGLENDLESQVELRPTEERPSRAEEERGSFREYQTAGDRREREHF